jgi:tol-pal system protein YbgF
MASHGQKTEEQRHVFNKNTVDLTDERAQGLKILCLYSILFTAFSIGPAYAQGAPVYSTPNASAQMEVRLQQMETQVRELTGKIEEQAFEIRQLKQTIRNMGEGMADQQQLGASQLARPEREAPKARLENPLNLEYKMQQEPAGMKTAVPGGVPMDATSQYEFAIANLKNEKYEEAREGFQTFLAENKDHVLAPNAKYWLGETYYVQGEYKTAARTFAEGFQAYPDSAKSPDILLKLGMSLAGMGKNGDACIALAQLPVKFPHGHDPILSRGQQEMDKLGCES